MSAVLAVAVLALGSGAAVFVGIGAIVLAARWPFGVALIAAGATVIAVWGALIGRAWRLLVAREIVHGEPAVAPAPRELVTVEVTEPDRGRMSWLDVPCTAEQLEQLARGLVLGRSFAEAEWCGGGRIFSVREFRALRSDLLERGLIEWRDARYPSQGITLSHAGKALMARIAEQGAHTHTRVLPLDDPRLLGDGR